MDLKSQVPQKSRLRFLGAIYLYMVLTKKYKLSPTSDQLPILAETLEQFKVATQVVLTYGFDNKVVNGVELHHATYYPIREQFPTLTSNYVCSAILRATSTLKAIKTKTKFKGKSPITKATSFDLVKDTCTIKENSIRISTTQGRIEIPFINYDALNYGILPQKGCSLMYKKGQWYLRCFYDVPDAIPLPQTNLLGIDRGCNNVVVLSNNKFISSKELKRIKGKYKWLRQQLQSKGTLSAKKLLKKFSGKEHRFVTDYNHKLSKYLVSLDYDTYILEDLNIKKQKKNGKKFNAILGGWSFYQLEQFLTYKAILKGKSVQYVDARYTSQKCSKCGHIEKSNRSGNQFHCKACEFQLHADLNAARNILQNYITAMGTSRSKLGAINHPDISQTLVEMNQTLKV